MDTARQEKYIDNFRKIIMQQTVSDPDCGNGPEDFAKFRELTW